MENDIKSYLAAIGRKGGQASTEKKRQALKKSLAKARKVRMANLKKRKAQEKS